MIAAKQERDVGAACTPPASTQSTPWVHEFFCPNRKNSLSLSRHAASKTVVRVGCCFRVYVSRSFRVTTTLRQQYVSVYGGVAINVCVLVRVCASVFCVITTKHKRDVLRPAPRAAGCPKSPLPWGTGQTKRGVRLLSGLNAR